MINPIENHFYIENIINLLNQNLDFSDDSDFNLVHSLHSFPAKFPPSLPQYFIKNLTKEGDFVLDPMVGSGTTLIESAILNRKGIGYDLDPLAILMNQVKMSVYDKKNANTLLFKVLNQAKNILNEQSHLISEYFENLDENSKKFIDYWFDQITQKYLAALVIAISYIKNEPEKNLLKLIFSSIIITKNGGVSLAFDLAHTRPHRAKIAYDIKSQLILGEDFVNSPSSRQKLLTKKLKNVFSEFEKKGVYIIRNLLDSEIKYIPELVYGNAKHLNLSDNSVDLIFTSPPYASNAIDYMRAHKFSLVWWEFDIDYLASLRKKYIGSEATTNFCLLSLPEKTTNIIKTISKIDPKKGKNIHRYYSEIFEVLQEMYRVLRPGKSAIFVVGDSLIRNISVEIDQCFKELGETVGFLVPEIGVRNIHRDKRMMPISKNGNGYSNIENRMIEEYVIAFFKPT